jgi:hypothetical protein
VSDLREAIIADASARRARRWIDRLPDDVREELVTIRREWQQGIIHATQRGLATAIVDNCKERGIEPFGFEGVREWLRRKD